MQIKKDIIDLLKHKGPGYRPLLFKGERELAALSEWLESKDAGSASVPSVDLSIEQMIEQCEKCGEVIDRKPGYGNGSNGLMVILNSPVLISRIEKELYRTESIELLKKMIKAINLEFSECYITNLIKCDIKEKIMQPSEIVGNCEYLIKKEIEVYSPRIIIVMGDLIPLQRIVKDSRNITWHTVEHPITLLKNPELKRKAWETLKIVMQKIREN